MTLKLLRDRLSTWSTPGVALTYFSRRQRDVFSTSFGAEAGRERPDDEHGGRQLGERVDAHARGHDAGEDDQADAEHQDRDGVAEREPGHGLTSGYSSGLDAAVASLFLG